MARARERERDAGEGRFELGEWLSAVLVLGAVLVGAVGTLGLTYLLLAAR
jgi:hypothetical protein